MGAVRILNHVVDSGPYVSYFNTFEGETTFAPDTPNTQVPVALAVRPTAERVALSNFTTPWNPHASRASRSRNTWPSASCVREMTGREE